MATQCTREGCPLAETGQCIEGFQPTECPYRLAEAMDTNEEASVSQFVTIPSGEALTPEEAEDVTRAMNTTVVMLAGPADAGKTTILTSLFEGFLEAPVGSALFAGSSTLVGFERRCHSGRAASGNPEAKTLHTSTRDGVRFLHLNVVASDELTSRRALLISDVAGETFRQLMDSRAVVESLPVLWRVDHFDVVIDCSRVLELTSRHTAISGARALFRSLIDAKALHPDCALGVLFTKWDLIVENGTDAIVRFLAESKELLSRSVGERRLTFYEVAARPETPSVPFAHGVPTLLRAWMTNSRCDADLLLGLTDEHSREFERSGRAVMAKYRLDKRHAVKWR